MLGMSCLLAQRVRESVKVKVRMSRAVEVERAVKRVRERALTLRATRLTLYVGSGRMYQVKNSINSIAH